ncbi:MAG: hypothetical protein IPM54_35635 [Polyangiaceae bacterium]|nr:hypothetical protein [Polyangiaceae bacterium]
MKILVSALLKSVVALACLAVGVKLTGLYKSHVSTATLFVIIGLFIWADALRNWFRDEREIDLKLPVAVVMVVYGILGGLFFRWWGEWLHDKKQQITHFNVDDHMAAYTKTYFKQYVGKRPNVSKVLIVDVRNRQVHPATFALPDEMKPSRAEEVDTVVQVDCTSSSTYNCTVTAVSLTDQTVLTKSSYRGSKSAPVREGQTLAGIDQDILTFAKLLK